MYLLNLNDIIHKKCNELRVKIVLNIPFTATQIEEENVQISIFDVEHADNLVKQCIDAHVCGICEGVTNSDISAIKLRLRNLFNTKDDRWQMGAIAEFFIHLYMRINGYKQECLFFNLEEKSIKKGFDGFYSKNNLPWIMESKSGSIITEGICHKSKLQEAIRDLKQKFEGNVTNNPWENAFNHASHVDVGTAAKLRDDIKKLAHNFERQIFCTIQDMNVIPCATIFLEGNWERYNHHDLIKEIKLADILNAKRVHAICVTQKSKELFLQYILG